jgi:ABC-type branched-subunit amino acid transport system substrate-binding protein
MQGRTHLRHRLGATVATLTIVCGIITMGTSSGAGASKPPLKIGILATLSIPGTAAQPFAGVLDGIKARITAQTKAGGVGGRKLEVVDTIDDQASPTVDAQGQTKLVDDGVNAAFVYAAGFVNSATLQKAKILFLGGGFVPGYCNSSATYGFSIVGCGNSTVWGGTENVGQAVPLLKGAPKTIAITGENTAGTEAGVATLKQEFTKEGWKVCTTNSTISETATDLTPYAASVVKSCGGQAPSMISNILNATPIAMTGAEKALGFKGIIMNYTTHVPAYLQSAQTAATLSGTYEQDYALGSPENSPSDFKTMNAQLSAIGKTYSGLGTAEGWATADQYIKMLTKVGASKTDTQIAAAFNKGATLPGVKGIYAPSKWPFNRNAPTPCGSTVKVVNAKFVGVAPLQCFKTFKLSQ